jgi:hypothetical protein
MSVSKVKTRDYPITDPKRGINYVKTITTNHTVRNEDKGWLIVINAAFATTISVPPLSVPVGSQIDFFRTNTGAITFLASGGATILSSGNQLADTNTAATLIKISDTEYLLVGKLS